MVFGISIWDLGLFAAIASTLMLTASYLMSPRLGRLHLLLDVRKLRNAAITAGIVFICLAVFKITVGLIS